MVAAAPPEQNALAVVQAKCAACHSGAKTNGGLAVDTLAAMLKGGKHGAVVVAGAPEKSLLWERIEKNEMPPANSKLTLSDAERSLIREWIRTLPTSATANAAPVKGRTGNDLDHAALFATKTFAPLDNPPRLWRLSPNIYGDFVRDLTKNRITITQAFSSNGKDGFTDFADGGLVDEPTTVILLRNAASLVDYQTQRPAKEIAAVLGRVPSRPEMQAALRLHFRTVVQREPSAEELERFTVLMAKNIKDAPEASAKMTLAAVYLLPEVVFRLELGQGPADVQGRRRLGQREIAYALSYALTDHRPDAPLLAAADTGKLASREQVLQQVQRLVGDPKTLEAPRGDVPRILRFFREFFGYHAAVDVFKNDKDNPDHVAGALVGDTDRLVRYIYEQDKDVFKQLLTTNQAFVAGGKKATYKSYNLDAQPEQQPVELPKEQRAGILTQPSWLVAKSDNTDNHAILRGKWIRERLLGGTVPDLPITVDAQLPEAPHKTLRQRMEVTQQSYCWQCHQRMNPLGLTFENFDHFGRFRTKELDKPVNASGLVENSGDPKLDGKVDSSLELIRKLADSDKARQMFVRHAFRYWLGREENVGDARTLQDADRAYVQSGGSMKALIAALLTSDSFLYRTVPTAAR